VGVPSRVGFLGRSSGLRLAFSGKALALLLEKAGVGIKAPIPYSPHIELFRLEAGSRSGAELLALTYRSVIAARRLGLTEISI